MLLSSARAKLKRRHQAAANCTIAKPTLNCNIEQSQPICHCMLHREVTVQLSSAKRKAPPSCSNHRLATSMINRKGMAEIVRSSRMKDKASVFRFSTKILVLCTLVAMFVQDLFARCCNWPSVRFAFQGVLSPIVTATAAVLIRMCAHMTGWPFRNESEQRNSAISLTKARTVHTIKTYGCRKRTVNIRS